MEIRPYDPTRDRAALWELKAAFERGLGGGTGDEAKAETYERKLTDAYRGRYLDWVARCVAEDEHCVTVAATDRGDLTGYVFLLPESLAMIWDAAVLNELYVSFDRRGTGVADDLLDAALGVAREQSLPLDRMVLDVDRENERARAFYERHGFARWGQIVAREL